LQAVFVFLQLSRAPAVADVHLHVQPGPVEPRVDEADEALRRLLIGALGRVLAGRAVAEAREVDAVDVDALPAVTLRVSDHRLDPRTLIATVSHIHDRVAARVGALVVVEDCAPAALLVQIPRRLRVATENARRRLTVRSRLPRAGVRALVDEDPVAAVVDLITNVGAPALEHPHLVAPPAAHTQYLAARLPECMR
jgi:hypothetical protein